MSKAKHPVTKPMIANAKKAGKVPTETITIPVHDTQGNKVGSHSHKHHAGSVTQGGKGLPGKTKNTPPGVQNLPAPYPGAKAAK